MTLIAAIAAALALMPAAAQAEGVDGGNVHLRLSKALAKELGCEGVRLAGVKPATASRTGVTLPISSGLLEQHFGSGYLFLEGGFKFQAGKRSVKLNRFVLNTTKHTLYANVNGIATTLAKLPEQQVTREGFSLDLALRSLQLTPKAAKALNRKLGLDRVFKAGRSLGLATAVAHFEWLGVTGGEIVFTIEEGFRKKLTSVEAFLGASGSATLRNAVLGEVAMPLEGGQVAPDGSAGVLLSQGGLSFAQHDEPFDHTIAFLDTNLGLESHLVTGDANYNPNPQQIPFSGPFAALGSPNFPGAGGGDPDTGVVSSPPVPAYLNPNFAKVLNEVFGAPKGKPELFTAGETIGYFAYEARTR
jgi:hypothetical protein